jgi:lipopolysaccharide transport system ATP-binding protein
MMLEAGNYSIVVTLGYPTGLNQGERLDRTPPLGPIQLTWDFGQRTAPFIGLCGLPAHGAFKGK